MKMHGDYPRVCGEKAARVDRPEKGQGSPPRMRGKVVRRSGRRLRLGITPAYAGKSRSQPRLPCTGKDHPRMCGEKNMCLSVRPIRTGSPPRVRGKDVLPHGLTLTVWITPAYAGKSDRCGTSPEMPWDHPRVCGEKYCLPAQKPPVEGSPPRVRGKVLEESTDLYHLGITLACAGKS